MIKFVVRRLIMMIPVLLGVTFIIFTMLYFTPGDAADMILGDSATVQQRELLREQLHLNEPFLMQYGNYIKNIITKGDLGTSYTTRLSVTKELLTYFPTTIKLAVFSSFLAAILGIIFGIISATKQYSIIDKITTALALVGVSMPNFWLGMMLIIVFAVNLRWLPPSGFNTAASWILPTITLSCVGVAQLTRMTRSSMLEVIRQDYIRTARSKGLGESAIVFRHALKNALIPVITAIGLTVSRLLGGAVLAESVFSVPGLGKLMVDAIKQRNFPIVQGGVLLIAFSMSVVNLIVDILYAFADPRIRSQYIRSRKNRISFVKGAKTGEQA
ncbi:MAG: ABC transporter permease [Clostridiaceae bacterium]